VELHARRRNKTATMLRDVESLLSSSPSSFVLIVTAGSIPSRLKQLESDFSGRAAIAKSSQQQTP
jgi:hypothetical protein